ncbi:MAG: DNA-binding domain of ModE / Molybdate-binding domain of ModE [uncultured Sulfurovum sp.]|uniref:DNA-binding domain of ModE / Molybdate-binding domain of ModE n=1 Tax=uncultured Sulfurovum sp. TaxID=269237 RepID=A0A6S6SS13_9BACT|nr:MAG: DNA-binding domain of ModE / Molybdate-binding domain of ModE [uncultured Sulfurovum sp.]
MNISSNLTLELFNQPFLLEKRIELLFAIGRTGSITKAAKEVPMSYKTAWEAVDKMNNLAHTPVVVKATGGMGGGGTKLTPYGENLLLSYRQLQSEHQRFLKRLQELTDIDKGVLNDIGRLGLQISARNQIQGRIKSIKQKEVNSEIILALKSGYELTSIITNTAVESLNLKVSDEVMAIFKSTSVKIVEGEVEEKNVFNGLVTHIEKGKDNAEIILDIGEGETLVAVMPISKELLSVTVKAHAVISAKDIMIGR